MSDWTTGMTPTQASLYAAQVKLDSSMDKAARRKPRQTRKRQTEQLRVSVVDMLREAGLPIPGE